MKFFGKYYASLTWLFVFVIYLFTLCPSIAPIDAGELVTVQILPGIAHPTGYPLFTITGYLFSLIPFFSSKIFQMNLLAAVWSSLAIYFFLKSVELFFETLKLNNPSKKESKKRKSKKNVPGNKGERILLNDESRKIAIVMGAFSLAFSKTFWLTSTSVEVYPLQSFLFALIIFAILKAYLNNSKTEKYWLYVAVALALGFSNHMTTILILPGLAVLYFEKEGFSKKSFLTIAKMLLLFFAILILFYLYLPLRAAAKPLLNWGNPVNFENFWRHFTGRQYSVWLFSSFDSAKKQFYYYVSNFPSEFGYLFWLLALVPFWRRGVFNKNKIVAFFLINFFITVFYSINYDIHDIDSYFILSYFSVAFLIALGTAKLFILIDKAKLPYFISVLVLLFGVEQTFNKPHKNDYYVLEDYTNSILNAVEPNSVILTYQWDYFVSPSYYLQIVEKRRPDVTVVDKELLRRSWYYNQLQSRDSTVLRRILPLVREFKTALKPFERGEKFNAQLLEKLYRSILTNLVVTNFPDRNIYILPELIDNEMRRGEFVLPKGFSLVPLWFGYKVVKNEKYYAEKIPNLKIRFPKYPDHYSDFVKKLITEMLTKRALYELSFNRKEKAKQLTEMLLRFNPNATIPPQLGNLISG